eukprot:TRINITY_DN12234_c0_g1_i2.p1 TRINITY_DN12234_c0_g1~~TRINITY_DN12234_c0_g1_i2.p1  ORF type:complete len:535 (+),score=138.42 TRINITY_DN12234_c0_g1_i2:116-1606(+)
MADTAAAPPADGGEPAAEERQGKKRAARARTFTTLRAPPPATERPRGSPTNAARSDSPRADSPRPADGDVDLDSPQPSPTGSPARREPSEASGAAIPQLTEEELQAAIDPRPVEQVNFHELFYKCCVTGRRPADRLFLKSWRAFTEEEAAKFAAENKDNAVAICYDLSDYDECAWNYAHGRYTTNDETEHFDDLVEALYTSKGSFMEEAVSSKASETVAGGGMTCCSTTMQGWRSANEDAHCALISLPEHPGVSCFGVYDGHGGWRVAAHVGKRLHDVIDAALPAEGLDADDDVLGGAVVSAFFSMDKDIDCSMKTDHKGAAGTTANVVLVSKRRILCANSGDSRAVLANASGCVPLSRDHKPDSPRETKRIRECGSKVSADGRVEGLLAVSRALGDFDFKQAGSMPPECQAVTALPDILIRDRTDGDEFVAQACDGIWDCMSNEQVCDFVRERLKRGVAVQEICEALCDHCLAPSIELDGVGTDNMSVNLIVFDS